MLFLFYFELDWEYLKYEIRWIVDVQNEKKCIYWMTMEIIQIIFYKLIFK